MVVHEGGKHPRRMAVRERSAAELEARNEANGALLTWVPQRRIEIVACAGACLPAETATA